MTCSVCVEQGYNKQYHSRPDAPDSGKMVPERGQRPTSSRNLGDDQTFHFIPTPMLSHEPRYDGLQSSDAAMVFTQPNSVHVPINDVNFEDVVDDMIDLRNVESATRISKP
ncbi:Hypothetical predicted protein [Olea europaea subsp. europaea]|uniref:Uncharacterized protein n=1 Tax=Olea europaea subsp. europaea TaxID=158383 RepID=A0A8S0R323_OLEEU|nr:Hypothetical predicted protein [Olea europaea subsp. europaea]